VAAAGDEVARLLVGVRFTGRSELDPAVRDLEQVGRLHRDLGQLRLDGRPAQQEPGNVGRVRRLPPLLFCLLGATAGAGGKRAHADCGDEVHGQRNPVLGLGQMERVLRR
jgi:hypothetical protein